MQIDSSLNSGWKCCLLLLLAVAFQSSFPDVASLAVWLELREHSCCVLEMSCVLCALQGLTYISHYHILYTYHCALYTCVASYPYSLCVCVHVCACVQVSFRLLYNQDRTGITASLGTMRDLVKRGIWRATLAIQDQPTTATSPDDALITLNV